MSEVFFISDLHLGHKRIAELRSPFMLQPFGDEEHHWQVLKDAWNRKITKKDIVWVLGDICFGEQYLPRLDALRGRKRFILGNHDLDAKLFVPYCEYMSGFARYKNYWLSHCPIHPAELRGWNNIHGHVHGATLIDRRYFNVCPENIGMAPISFEEIKLKCPVT